MMISTPPKLFQDSIGIGISLQCSSTLITCLYTSYASEVKINISGPDIVAALFVVNWATRIVRQSKVRERGGTSNITYAHMVFHIYYGLHMAILWTVSTDQDYKFFPEPVVNGFLGCIAWKVF